MVIVAGTHTSFPVFVYWCGMNYSGEYFDSFSHATEQHRARGICGLTVWK